MAKDGDVDIPRLCDNIKRARLAMVRPRQTVVNLAREVAGPHWSEEGAVRDIPVNFLSVYQSIITRNLIPKNPRVMLSTFRRSLKPTIAAMERWTNQQIIRMKLATILRRVVINGLYSMGVAKVALADPSQSAAASWNLRAGEPCVWSIDLDDYVQDIHSREEGDYSFRGHRYRVPFASVKDSKMYSKWVRAKINPSYDSIFNQEGDERLSLLGRTMYASDHEEFEPMVDLWEIYLPRQRRIVTLAEDQITGPMAGDVHSEPLSEKSWIGPDRGPYHILGYGWIPGNWMPKGPMQDIYKLHMTSNEVLRKLDRTMRRLKEVTLVRQGQSRDGEATIAANDGAMIDVADPSNITQVVMGGQHAQLLLAVYASLKNEVSFVGGNMELLGGRSPQSRTATQDRMLDENANAGVADMQDTTIDFTADVLDSLCWYWWHDPKLIMHTRHSLPGLPDMESVQRVYPNGFKNAQGQSPVLQRRGRFEELEIKVDPYSMQRSTPQKKLQDLNNVVQTIILPMMQLLMQQGKSFDVDAYLRKVAQWMDQPDLADIITIQEPPEMDADSSLGDKPPMPNSTEGEYTRHNVSDRTPQGDRQQLIAQMLGHSMGGDNRNGKQVGAMQ